MALFVFLVIRTIDPKSSCGAQLPSVAHREPRKNSAGYPANPLLVEWLLEAKADAAFQ